MILEKRNPPVGARPATLAIPEGSPAPQIHLFHYGPGQVVERSIERLHRAGAIRPDRHDHLDRHPGSRRRAEAAGDRFDLRHSWDRARRCRQRAAARQDRGLRRTHPGHDRAHSQQPFDASSNVPRSAPARGHTTSSRSRSATSPSSTAYAPGFAIRPACCGGPGRRCSPMPWRTCWSTSSIRWSRRSRSSSTTSRRASSRSRRPSWSPSSIVSSVASPPCAGLRAQVEALYRLAHADSPLVPQDSSLYLKDVEDHARQILGRLDACRDIADRHDVPCSPPSAIARTR